MNELQEQIVELLQSPRNLLQARELMEGMTEEEKAELMVEACERLSDRADKYFEEDPQ